MSLATGLLAAACAAAVGAVLLARERVRVRRLRETAGPRHARLAPGADRPRLVGPAAVAAGVFAALLAATTPADDGGHRDDAGGVDLVLCLDVSRSMLARDTAPDRLSRAKAEVRALCERARGDRVGLVLFAGEARLAVPLTRDLRSLADLADAADPASVARGGTDLAAALATAGDALAGAGDGPRAVCLLTDGEDPAGRGERAADGLRARGIAVHAVGFGTARGGKIPLEEAAGGATWLATPDRGDVVTALDVAGLRRIAEAGGGAYAEGDGAGRPLVALYEARVASAPRADAASGRGGSPVRFQGPLAAALLLWAVDLGTSRRSLRGGARRRP